MSSRWACHAGTETVTCTILSVRYSTADGQSLSPLLRLELPGAGSPDSQVLGAQWEQVLWQAW